jgi:hypothetical protein
MSAAPDPEPRVHLHPNTVRIDAACGYAQACWLQNSGAGPAAFAVVGAGGSSGTSGFGGLPSWLEVCPAAGVVAAGDSVELALRGSPASQQWGLVGPQTEELVVAVAPLGGAAAAAWPTGVLTNRYGTLQLRVSLS